MPRLASRLIVALALTACGGAPGLAPDDLSASAIAAPTGLSTAALGIPSPSPALRRLAGSHAPLHPIDDPDDPRLYEILVSLSGPRAFLLAADARPDHDPRRLDPEESGPAPACPSDLCGRGSLPVGAPAEAALLLAIADLHWRGPGVNRSMVRTAVDDAEADTVGSTRQIIRFAAGSDVQCAAQQKVFSAEAAPMGEAADPVVAAHQKAVGIDPSRLPVAGSQAGGGQLLLRQRTAPEGYVLELHVAFDHGRPQEAEVLDAVVVCRSPRPIDPARLPGHAHRLARDPAGHWAAVVFPR